jgi:hypothetical protein
LCGSARGGPTSSQRLVICFATAPAALDPYPPARQGRRWSFRQKMTAMAARLLCKSLRNVSQ